VIDGHLYVTSNAGYVYSLDADTGCVHWSFRSQAVVRSGGAPDLARHSKNHAVFSRSRSTVPPKDMPWCSNLNHHGPRAATVRSKDGVPGSTAGGTSTRARNEGQSYAV